MNDFPKRIACQFIKDVMTRRTLVEVGKGPRSLSRTPCLSHPLLIVSQEVSLGHATGRTSVAARYFVLDDETTYAVLPATMPGFNETAGLVLLRVVTNKGQFAIEH